MERSEPTTDEIVRVLREEARFELGGRASTIHLITVKDAIDRLQSQQRDNAFLVDEWTKTANVCVELRAENERLTAERDAEKARADAAVADIEQLLAQDDFLGMCWACERECGKDGECKPKWRGEKGKATE